jgi:hypothetical protein
MALNKGSTSPKTVIEDHLGRQMTRQIWSGNYTKALPISFQKFDLSAVLPAIFYMFRFGQRRGKGMFTETFGLSKGSMREKRRSTTIERITNKLSKTEYFKNFNGDVGNAILGDLLLCFCLENIKGALGRNEQVQRVAPTHYFSCWVDLPESVSHLRNVPEMIVSMLANQKNQTIMQNQKNDRTWFPVGEGFESNVLIRPFLDGVQLQGELGSRTSDKFEENIPVGLDQLLMIRLAQELGSAPEKLRGKEGDKISNQQPISEKAGREFSEDIRRFVRSYANVIPRQAFVGMLESCMAVGLTTIFTSVSEILFNWSVKGEILTVNDQEPALLFVDCSNGIDRNLKAISEQSLNDFLRRLDRLPVILMALRLLDWQARYDVRIKKLNVSSRPCAKEWINLLGDLLLERREEAELLLYDLSQKAEAIAENLEEDYQEVSQIIRSEYAQPNPVWRLSEALTYLQGKKISQHLTELFDSCLMIGSPNGLGSKRSTTRRVSQLTTSRKRMATHSLVLKDTALDYLVHLHILKSGNKIGVKPLSLNDFISRLYDRYGFCIDIAPQNMTISNEQLQKNRKILERRLRDLGLLVGVNDAESMKRLRPRFETVKEM